jgi:hypothetical protein
MVKEVHLPHLPSPMRIVSILAAFAGLLAPARATTLQQLGLDEIIQKSTAIVRAKVLGSAGRLRGQDIYTFYQLQVLEDFSAQGAAAPSHESLAPPQRSVVRGSVERSAGVRQMEVAVPGGSAGGLRQIVSGAPVLNAGDEYVFFLWTSPSGLTQVIGLSQGLFSVKETGQGDPVLARRPTSELMLDKYGRAVDDQSVSMRLSELRGRVQRVLRADK